MFKNNVEKKEDTFRQNKYSHPAKNVYSWAKLITDDYKFLLREILRDFCVSINSFTCVSIFRNYFSRVHVTRFARSRSQTHFACQDYSRLLNLYIRNNINSSRLNQNWSLQLKLPITLYINLNSGLPPKNWLSISYKFEKYLNAESIKCWKNFSIK